MKKLTTQEISKFWRTTYINIPKDNIEIDISNYNFISHAALVNFASLIDYYLTENKRNILITLPRLSEEFIAKFEVIKKISKFDRKNINKFLHNYSIKLSTDDYFKNWLVLKFMSFLKHSGFIDIWTDVFTAGRVKFLNFNKSIVEKLYIYRGRRSKQSFLNSDIKSLNSYHLGEHSRYSALKRIAGNPEQQKSALKDIVISLYLNLPEDQKKSPLFNDNEFEEIFLEQLAENVANHAAGSKAYVIARSFSKDDLLHSNYEYSLPEVDDSFKNKCKLNGFFEIIISDNGAGIDNTLSDAYRIVLKSIFGKEIEFRPEDVIAFSLDEFGSRYVDESNKFKALIDQHSLNLLLKYTIKYGGHLRLLSNSSCLSYDTNKRIQRGKWGIGFKGVKEEGDYFQKGLNVRVILPHVRSYNSNYPKSRYLKWADELPDRNKLAHAIYLGVELSNNPSKKQINKKIVQITKWAIQKRLDRLVIDFSGLNEWSGENFIYLIEKLQNLSSSILCWGINVPQNILGIIYNKFNKSKRFLPFLCIDDSEDRDIYLVSKDTFKISKGLSILFKDQIDDNGNKILEPRNIDDIRMSIKDLNGENISNNELNNILTFSSNLFVNDLRNNCWTGLIEYSELLKSITYLLQYNFNELLKITKTIHKTEVSDKREKIFMLPSSGKKVYEYLWTYNLLQNGNHTEEISVRIKSLFLNYYLSIKNDFVSLNKFDAIVCVTAPGRIVAQALSRKFEHQPMVIDLGGVTHLDPEELLGSLTKDKEKELKCLIVTDVLDTGNLIKRIINLLINRNIKTIGVAAIIKFVDGESRWAGIVEENLMQIGSENIKVPIGVLYYYKRPKKFEGKLDIKKHKLYLIEPYSLRPYLSEVLYDQFYAWEFIERIREYPSRIAQIDNKKCIIYGHFRDRNHHNKVMIHMPRLLSDEEITDSICEDIILFIEKHLPTVIIVPLHSNIHHLVPKLKVKLRELSYNIPVICTIAVDLKGRGPFYILPDEVSNILISAKKFKLAQVNIMFLDDGVLTGRTLETFLRAVCLFKRREPKENVRRIDTVLVYCIVNRVGRAATTKWREITSIFEKEKTKFMFREYIKFEYPVFSAEDCPICKHIERLNEYLDSDSYKGTRILEWIENEKKQYEALILNSKEYNGYQVDPLPEYSGESNFLLIDDDPTTIRDRMTPKEQLYLIKHPKLSTIQGSFWWLWERSYRGTPAKYLIDKYSEWVNSFKGLEEETKEMLIAELLLWATENIDDFKTPSSWNVSPYQNEELSKQLIDIFEQFLNSGSKFIPRLLDKIAFCLIKRVSYYSSISDLLKLLKLSIQAIIIQLSTDRVLNILLGIYLIIMRLRKNECLTPIKDKIEAEIKESSKRTEKWTRYFETLLQFLEAENIEAKNTNDEFRHSLRLLCQERYKKRHPYVFDAKYKEIDLSNNIKEELGYLIDALPKMSNAVEIVLKADRKLNDNIEKEIELFQNSIKSVIKILKSDQPDKFKAKITEKLDTAEYYLKGENTEIGRVIDFYHPNVYQEMKKLIDEENGSSGRIEYIKHIHFLDETDQDLCIIGDKRLLRETLKNNSIDILRQWYDEGEKNIGILVSSDASYCSIKIYYSSIDPDVGQQNIRGGTSFTMCNSHWERYGGKLIQHEISDREQYKSFVRIKAQKGFIRGGK